MIADRCDACHSTHLPWRLASALVSTLILGVTLGFTTLEGVAAVVAFASGLWAIHSWALLVWDLNRTPRAHVERAKPVLRFLEVVREYTANEATEPVGDHR